MSRRHAPTHPALRFGGVGSGAEAAGSAGVLPSAGPEAENLRTHSRDVKSLSAGRRRLARPVPHSITRGGTSSPSGTAEGERHATSPAGALRDRIARGRRRRDLEAAVPEALDVLRATVGSGASPATGLVAIAESATGPLADVLNGAARACALGVPAGRALADAGAAASVTELVTTGEALDLAATTGAPPGPVLAGVARAATDRLRARQARLAATAGARLSVKVLAALGPGFVGLLAVTAPNDIAFLVQEPGGWMTLALALAFEVAGLLWARRILEDRR
jgi:tight adherence protein B